MNRLAIVLLLLVSVRTATAADAPAPQPAPLKADVLAHGDDKQFWVADVSQTTMPPAQHTSVYYRVLGQDQHWQLLASVAARVVGVGSQGSTAGLLMEDGSWSLLYSDGNLLTAGSLPKPAKMVALAGGRNNWWALAEVPGGMAAATTLPAATTRAASPSARGPATAAKPAPAAHPASRPTEARLVLFELAGNEWGPISELPGRPDEAAHASLELVDGVPYVANLDDQGILKIRHLEKKQWMSDLRLNDLPRVAGFKLLDGAPPPRLWIEQPSGPDLVYAIGQHGEKPLELAPLPGSFAHTRTLALFAGKLRMIALVDHTLKEQDFSIKSGASESGPADLPLPKISPLMDLQTLQTVVVIATFVAILFGWYRQQAQTPGAVPDLETIKLAPLGRRFVAGLIDASPVVLTVLITGIRDANTPKMSAPSQELVLWLAYWAAGLFYVLYMTIMEALAGRSVGKIVMGLHVAGIDGKPATQTALITRNVLRLFDVGVFFFPVMMIPLFPLRQRPGDVAAGTLVIVGGSGPTQPTNAAQSTVATGQKPPEK